MTNLIATKVGLTSNNTISGSNTFSNLPYYVNTTDQLINKNYVDGRFTSLTTSLTYFTGSGVVTVNLNALDASNNFNMYEFRCTAADTVHFIANGTTVYDNLNVSRSTNFTTSQKYFKFHYIEQNGTFYYHQFI